MLIYGCLLRWFDVLLFVILFPALLLMAFLEFFFGNIYVCRTCGAFFYLRYHPNRADIDCLSTRLANHYSNHIKHCAFHLQNLPNLPPPTIRVQGTGDSYTRQTYTFCSWRCYHFHVIVKRDIHVRRLQLKFRKRTRGSTG